MIDLLFLADRRRMIPQGCRLSKSQLVRYPLRGPS